MSNDSSILMAGVSRSRWGEIPTAAMYSSSCLAALSEREILAVPKASGFSCSLKRKRPPKIEIPNILREIPADIFRCSSAQGEDDGAVCFSDSGVGVYSIKGKKKFMEDAHRVVSSSSDSKGFFGVYDGHGGSKAAKYVAENLHMRIFEMLEKSSEKNAKEEAIKAAYLKTDEEFLKQDLSSGACCVTALIEGREMAISNLGDCRAVLSRGGTAEVLTTDHRPALEDERKRIEGKGGCVVFHRGSWRVHGSLAVSRSFGDAHLKNWVVAEPETKVISLTPDMDYLVLASDGLWDEVGSQEAVDLLMRYHSSSRKGQSRPHQKLCCERPSDPNYPGILLAKSNRISDKNTEKPNAGPLQQGEDDLCSEDGGSPASKCQRISRAKHMKIKTTPVQNNENEGPIKKPAHEELVAVCKELADLAVSRGCLDDITVMIVDLQHHCRC